MLRSQLGLRGGGGCPGGVAAGDSNINRDAMHL